MKFNHEEMEAQQNRAGLWDFINLLYHRKCPDM